MAIYHCSMRIFSRAAGQSIVAAAAYRHGCKLEDSRTGEIHNYSRKQGIESSELYFPSDISPEWDREQIWNNAEAAENRKNSRVGRELVLALPIELMPDQRRELTGEMARYLADRYGVVVDVAIHQPSRQGDDRNHHAHLLMSTRRITAQGFSEKVRELDDRERGPAEVEHIRAEWARLANHALERAGQHVQIDHRSFQRQRLKRMPSLHLGPSASAMERRGIPTRLGDWNRAAQAVNVYAAAMEREQQAQAQITLDQRQSGHDGREAVSEKKTPPRPIVDRKNVLEGMAAFRSGYEAHKQEKAEQNRIRREKQEREKKQQEMAWERLKRIERYMASGKVSSNPEWAFMGHYKAWLEERGEPKKPLTCAEMQHADWIVSCRMLVQGHNHDVIKDVLHRYSPAAALEGRGIMESSAIVDRALKHPEVQRERQETFQKEKQREQERNRSGFSMGR